MNQKSHTGIFSAHLWKAKFSLDFYDRAGIKDRLIAFAWSLIIVTTAISQGELGAEALPQQALVQPSAAPLAASLAAAPLTDAEADEIIAEREAEKAEHKASRMAELEQATVISEGRGVLKNGRVVIIREVEPPATSTVQENTPVEPSTPVEPTEAQLTEWRAYQAKDHRTLVLSATVYEHELTRVNWSLDGIAYIAYTNANFNYLRGVDSLKNDALTITVLLGVGNATYANDPYPNEAIPPLSDFSEERIEYTLTKGDPVNEAALTGIELLLDHYETNLPSLKVAHQNRAALNAAQKRYQANHPKEAEPFIVQFWIPASGNEKDQSAK